MIESDGLLVIDTPSHAAEETVKAKLQSNKIVEEQSPRFDFKTLQFQSSVATNEVVCDALTERREQQMQELFAAVNKRRRSKSRAESGLTPEGQTLISPQIDSPDGRESGFAALYRRANDGQNDDFQRSVFLNFKNMS